MKRKEFNNDEDLRIYLGMLDFLSLIISCPKKWQSIRWVQKDKSHIEIITY
jgi:hypothetical protein